MEEDMDSSSASDLDSAPICADNSMDTGETNEVSIDDNLLVMETPAQSTSSNEIGSCAEDLAIQSAEGCSKSPTKSSRLVADIDESASSVEQINQIASDVMDCVNVDTDILIPSNSVIQCDNCPEPVVIEDSLTTGTDLTNDGGVNDSSDSPVTSSPPTDMRADIPWERTTDLVDNLCYLFKEQRCCDVTFNIKSSDGTCSRISGHKVVLISQSVVFEKLISCKQSGEDILIQHCSPKNFMTMLWFLYKHEVNFDEHNSLELWILSHKYMIHDLVTICENSLIISHENIFDILDHIQIMNASDEDNELINCLLRRGLQFLAENFTMLTEKQGFLKLDHQILKMILSRNDLLVGSELAVFQACVAWAKNKILVSSDPTRVNDNESIREQLGKSFYLIRFCYMSPSEYTKFVSGFMSEEENMLFLLHIHGLSSESDSRKIQDIGFVTSSRMSMYQMVKRFSKLSVCREYKANGVPEVMLVKVKNPVYFGGVAILPGGAADVHNVTVTISKCHTNTKASHSYSTKLESPSFEHHASSLLCHDKTCFKLEANVRYQLSVSVSGPKTYSGEITSGTIRQYICANKKKIEISVVTHTEEKKSRVSGILIYPITKHTSY